MTQIVSNAKRNKGALFRRRRAPFHARLSSKIKASVYGRRAGRERVAADKRVEPGCQTTNNVSLPASRVINHAGPRGERDNCASVPAESFGAGAARDSVRRSHTARRTGPIAVTLEPCETSRRRRERRAFPALPGIDGRRGEKNSRGPRPSESRDTAK